MKWDTFLTFTTMDSKLMKDLNVSQETIRILRRTQAAPFLPQLQPLLDVSPEARERKENELWGLHQGKSIFTAKESVYLKGNLQNLSLIHI